MYKRLLMVGLLCAPAWAAPLVLSDNLNQPQGSIGYASFSYWTAQRFSTGAEGGHISQAVLLMNRQSTGAAVVDIYTVASGLPGTLVGSLSTSAAYTSVPSLQTYTGSVFVTPNTAYYAVLRATSGDFYWIYTTSELGSGVGYNSTWTYTDNGGASWESPSSIAPHMMSITLSTDVPEFDGSNAPLALSLMAGLLLSCARSRRVGPARG